ncbi:hypothetical protein BJV74DRAFT_798400 [Russula compacta]|nr:hypothetical protein BJV74DRAFT_798400 [Russula compacta]
MIRLQGACDGEYFFEFYPEHLDTAEISKEAGQFKFLVPYLVRVIDEDDEEFLHCGELGRKRSGLVDGFGMGQQGDAEVVILRDYLNRVILFFHTVKKPGKVQNGEHGDIEHDLDILEVWGRKSSHERALKNEP